MGVVPMFQRRVSDRNIASFVTSLSPRERHVILISLHAFCMVWKTSTVVRFTTVAFTGEKKEIDSKQTWHCRYLRKWMRVTIAVR